MSSTEMRVLVVDDDADIREALRDTLEQEGYAVAHARDGSDALGYLKTHPPPALILLDWNMSPMNGEQFMGELLKSSSLSTIPVVLLSADARVQEKSQEHGYVGHLRKPVDLDVLFEMVGKYCAKA